MKKLLSSIPIAAAITFAPFAAAQVNDRASQVATNNSNAALDYWNIWETIDADLWSTATIADPSEAADSESDAFNALLRLQPDIRSLCCGW